MAGQLIQVPYGDTMVSRVAPALPVHAVKTYQMAQPLATHWRPATCAEVECPNYLNGWRVRVEGLPPQLLHAAAHSGRRHSRLDAGEGETWLVFEAGQPCFAASAHRIPAGRPLRFFERGGDWRGNPRGERRELNQADWVDSFANHQDRLAAEIGKG
jgi:hypothetical protein